jgi:RNase P subunit RPR2
MNTEKKRVCKKCDEVKVLSLFPITMSKKSKNITYRHTCKVCEKEGRRQYFKDYHKKKYVSKKKVIVVNETHSDTEIEDII